MAKDLSPFAKLLQDYMWEQRPPLNASKLARLLSVGQQTVSNWFNLGANPSPKMLERISRATGIPLTKLLHACGYPVTDDVWNFIFERLEKSTIIAPDARAEIIRHIADLRAQYEAEYRDPTNAVLVLLTEPNPDATSTKPTRRRKVR